MNNAGAFPAEGSTPAFVRRPLKLLLCCEFYHPSRGGVQEVMRQLAERFAAAGHDVTVATTKLLDRNFSVWNGVKIVEFEVLGNQVRGLEGEVERYRSFLRNFDGDAVLMKAAQQWTFDASWPALDDMKCRKVFIPCGFSALYEPAYERYFEELPAILAKFDSLIFYAEDYRDINFARTHGLTRLHILPNGASEKEFGSPPEPGIRGRLGIPEEALLFITVGTPISMKGHLEVAEAFARLDPRGRPMALVLNGQWGEKPIEAKPSGSQPPSPPPERERTDAVIEAKPSGSQRPSPPPERERTDAVAAIIRRARLTLKHGGIAAFIKRAVLWIYFRTLWLLVKVFKPILEPIGKVIHQAHRLIHRILAPHTPPPRLSRTIDEIVLEVAEEPLKTIVKTELPRAEVVELFFAADLFVFGSKVEYSPLVLFEACAAGLPFLSVPAGNSEEIARWTGGGEICPAEKDARGYIKVDPVVLAAHMDRLIEDEPRRRALSAAGRAAWQQRYTWSVISEQYVAILADDLGAGKTEVLRN